MGTREAISWRVGKRCMIFRNAKLYHLAVKLLYLKNGDFRNKQIFNT